MEQIAVVLVCALSGVFAGMFYEAVCVCRCFIKNKIARTAADVLFFIGFSFIFIGISVLFQLPDFRFYMFLAALLGFFLYLETIHRMLAFFAKKLYNKYRSSCVRFLTQLAYRRERRKVQKNSNRHNDSRNNTFGDPARILDLSDDRHIGTK